MFNHYSVTMVQSTLFSCNDVAQKQLASTFLFGELNTCINPGDRSHDIDFFSYAKGYNKRAQRRSAREKITCHVSAWPSRLVVLRPRESEIQECCAGISTPPPPPPPPPPPLPPFFKGEIILSLILVFPYMYKYQTQIVPNTNYAHGA